MNDGRVSWMRVMGLVTVVCIVGSLFLLYGRLNAETRRLQIQTYGNCLRLNDSRRRSQRVNSDDIAILFAAIAPGATTPTAEQQKFLTDLQGKVNARNAVVLKDTDCDKTAPSPSNLSDNEKKQLPKSEPIPPLRLP